MTYKSPFIYISTGTIGVYKVILERETGDGIKKVNLDLTMTKKVKEALDKLLPKLKFDFRAGGKMALYIHEDKIEVIDDTAKVLNYCTVSFELFKPQQDAFKEIINEVMREYGLDKIKFDKEERPVG